MSDDFRNFATNFGIPIYDKSAAPRIEGAGPQHDAHGASGKYSDASVARESGGRLSSTKRNSQTGLTRNQTAAGAPKSRDASTVDVARTTPAEMDGSTRPEGANPFEANALTTIGGVSALVATGQSGNEGELGRMAGKDLANTAQGVAGGQEGFSPVSQATAVVRTAGATHTAGFGLGRVIDDEPQRFGHLGRSRAPPGAFASNVAASEAPGTSHGARPRNLKSHGRITQSRQGARSKAETVQHASNPAQARLRTALNLNRQRKADFNRQLREKQTACTLSSTATLTAARPEQREEELRSMHLESMRLQSLADQCRRNNDYKSMAAVARVQQAQRNALSGRNIA